MERKPINHHGNNEDGDCLQTEGSNGAGPHLEDADGKTSEAPAGLDAVTTTDIARMSDPMTRADWVRVLRIVSHKLRAEGYAEHNSNIQLVNFFTQALIEDQGMEGLRQALVAELQCARPDELVDIARQLGLM